MTLTSHPTEPGLWQNTSVPADSAGVHALIIGVSDYPYLKDGSAPNLAPANGGMGQLEVSAQTAARVFEWLNKRGKAGGAPIASCRLCLSPRDVQRPTGDTERQKVDALTGGSYADATFSSIRRATEAWATALMKGSRSGQSNIGFFFFSGHGVEHVASPALLAQDILDPESVSGARNALAFLSLWRSLGTYGVDRAFFFVDACRNAPELVKTLHIVGEDVLEPAAHPGRPSEAVVWLHATRMGDFAYQSPKEEATIFGQGLLEGLEGPPPTHVPYDCSAVPWQLVFRNLERHVTQRVRELIRTHSTTILQPVKAGGDPYEGDVLVADKTPGEVPAQARAVPPHPPLPGDLRELISAGALDEDTSELVNARGESFLKGFHSVSHVTTRMLRESGAASWRTEHDLKSFSVMHEILLHESITDPFIRGLELLDVRTGMPIENASVELVHGKSHDTAEGMTAWLDMRVAPGAGDAIWIGWTGEDRAFAQRATGDEGPPSVAVVIPRDEYHPVPVRLELAFRKNRPQSMTARLADPEGMEPDTEHIWKLLWSIQRVEALADLASAGHAAAHLNVLEQAVLHKLRSPIAAALGAALLLRAGALNRLQDWPRNLADRAPWLADGPVLWAETLLRRPGSAHEQEARESFMACADRGPPLLGPVLTMAAQQAVRWRKDLDRYTVAGAAADRLSLACKTVERAVTYAVCGDAFPAFMCISEPLRLDMVFGTDTVQGAAVAQPQMMQYR